MYSNALLPFDLVHLVRPRLTSSRTRSQSRTTSSTSESPPLKGGDELDEVRTPARGPGRRRSTSSTPNPNLPPGPLTELEAADLERRMCMGHRRRSFLDAEAVARRARDAGDHRNAYPCPFCRRWHNGHPPALETVELLARFLRFGSEPAVEADGEVGS